LEHDISFVVVPFIREFERRVVGDLDERNNDGSVSDTASKQKESTTNQSVLRSHVKRVVNLPVDL